MHLVLDDFLFLAEPAQMARTMKTGLADFCIKAAG